MSLKQKAVAIIGAGTQGRRLAFMWSSRGRPVHIIDTSEQQLRDASEEVVSLRSRFPAFKTGVDWGRVDTCLSERKTDALSDSWLILECIPESLELKRKLFTSIEREAPQDAILASNSSSYTIQEIIRGIDLSHPERTVSMHSYWPPETCAIELMGSKKTDGSIIEKLMEECTDHGFQPFHVRGESVGYLYNRIWAAIKREALLTLSEGIATPKEIDAIFKTVLKTPMGPCEQMDVVGLDVVLDIEEHYAETRQGLPEAPRAFLREMLASGKKGVKSKSGFYEY